MRRVESAVGQPSCFSHPLDQSPTSRTAPEERREMFWLYFVAGHFVTGLVLVLLACLLTWQRPDRGDIRHALTYGYLNILHAPIYIYLYWTGQIGNEAAEQVEDGSTRHRSDDEHHVVDEAETADESSSSLA